ncbi:MAG: NAD-dependent epimerase/dehydratase family protein [Balneolaceae bacterium]
MNVFVTGGTGFVGSHLVDALIADPNYNEIRCLVRTDDKWLSDKKFTRIKGDLGDLNLISNALDGVDVIFHVAGVVRARTQKEFNRANVDATEDLLRVAQKKGINNIVILSSLAGVGPSDGVPLNEDAPLAPVSMYGHSKKLMEELIHSLAKETDSIKIIRPPAVYGPREADIYTYFKSFSKGICPIVGDGNHPRISMVYVSDLVDGIIKSSQKMDVGVHTYFISGKEDHNWNQIRDVTSVVMNKKTLAIKLKPALVKKISGLVESVASLFGQYPVINREKANEMVLEWTCSSQKAIDELGYQPSVSLEEGISRTIHWYKKNNWL